ncbi:MAG: DNA adenine methylase [Candidatus Margulisiibacteriota bacterium]
MSAFAAEIKLRIPKELSHKGIRAKVLHSQTIRSLRRKYFPGAEPFFTAYSGNKKALLPQYDDLFPGASRYDSYRSTCLGSGADFFSLEGRGRLGGKNVRLYEIVPDNANAFLQLQRDAAAVYRTLQVECGEVSKAKFDEVKGRFNRLSEGDPFIRAALTIYLANTVINGRLRCDKEGRLNVNFGNKSSRRVILDEQNAIAIQKALTGVDITCGDFSLSQEGARKGMFYFIDPPYYPYTQNESNHYGSSRFGTEDFVRLVAMTQLLGERGCLWMHSNSFYPAVANTMEWNNTPLALVYRIDLMNNFHDQAKNGSQTTYIPEYVARNFRTAGDADYVQEAQIMRDLFDLVLEAAKSGEDIADLLAARFTPLSRRLRIRVDTAQEFIAAIEELKRINNLESGTQLELC